MKRNGFLTLIGLAGLGGVLALGTPVHAGGVNCGIIKKDLEMGRTPEEIAELKVISVEEVKKCQAEAPAAGEKPAAAEPKAAEEKQPAQ
jgi:hypothetical protein